MTEEHTYPNVEEPETEVEKFTEPPPLPPALEDVLGPVETPPPLPPQESTPYFQAPPAYGEPAPDPFAEPEPPTYSPPPYTPSGASPSVTDMPPSTGKKNNTTLIIVIVVIAVLLLCCCCAFFGTFALFWEDIAYELGLNLLSLFRALP